MGYHYGSPRALGTHFRQDPDPNHDIAVDSFPELAEALGVAV